MNLLKSKFTRSWPVAALMTAALSPASYAQDVRCDEVSDFPCTYDVREVQVIRAAPVLKFQARMAQSGLALTDTTFSALFVKLLRGTETICLEQFKNVAVVDGVINLEIGPNMSCPLDETIAENNDLALQICPGSTQNCLKPAALGTTPYAVKASFTSLAQEAFHANVAGQSSYAHRMTADRDMLFRNRIGTGFFDFATPSAEDAVQLFTSAADFIDFENSGFLAWTPTRGTAMKVHIGGKNHASDRLVELTSLHLASEDTTLTGDLTVEPPADGKGLTVLGRGVHVIGDSDIDGKLVVSNALDVRSDGADISGDSTIHGRLDVEKQLTVKSGGIHVTGSSRVDGELSVSQMLEVLSNGAKITGATDIDGTLMVHARMTVSRDGLAVSGDSALHGALTVAGATTVSQGGLTVTSAGATVTAGGLSIGGGGLDVQGDATITGRLTSTDFEVAGSVYVTGAGAFPHRFFAIEGDKLAINPDQTLTSTVVKRQVRLLDQAIFEGPTFDPRQAQTFILASGESRDLAFGGMLTVEGPTSLTGGIIGGLDVSGPVTLRGGVQVPDGLTGALDITGDLSVTGATTLSGRVAIPAGVTGNLPISATLTGASLSVSGTSTFNGTLSIAGGISGPVSFAGAVSVGAAGSIRALGPTTTAALTVNNTLQANAGARFEGATSLGGGVTGNTTFANSVTVNGSATLAQAASLIGNLTVDGSATFNGPVAFGGSFAGTTRFENVAVSGTLNIDGLSLFSGAASLAGGVTGDLAIDTVSISSTLLVSGATVFDGPVDFRGGVTGLGELKAYVKSSGENRPLTLPGVVIDGDLTIGGSLTTSSGFTHLNVTSSTSIGDYTSVEGSAFIDGKLTVSGQVYVEDSFSVRICRLCLNYGDVGGTDPNNRRFACIRWEDGSDSGMLNFLGDVDDNDVIGLKFICDDGPSRTGRGWK
jgi:hypothetical protein